MTQLVCYHIVIPIMDNSYSPVKRHEKLSGQVAEQIQQLILSRQIKPGDRLPTERELGETFQVSRTVIREAIRILETRGLALSKTGSGTYVRAIQGEDVANSLGMYITTQGQFFTLDSLMEVRRVLEIQVVKLAAERATPQDIEKLESVLDHMRKSKNDVDAFSKWDLEFHMVIARASGNPLFEILIEPLTEALFELIWTGTSAPGAAEEACEFHRVILDSLEAKNGQKAADAMRLHLDQSQRVTAEGIKHRKED
jgi:GntR family transcriptional repressor for pyruvate dehydrogenase complex